MPERFELDYWIKLRDYTKFSKGMVNFLIPANDDRTGGDPSRLLRELEKGILMEIRSVSFEKKFRLNSIEREETNAQRGKLINIGRVIIFLRPCTCKGVRFAVFYDRY